MTVVHSREEYLRNLLGLMTEDDFMALLGVTDHTTQGWRVSGRGPKYVKLGKRVYYRVSDVTAWVDSHIHARTPSGRGQDDEDEAA